MLAVFLIRTLANTPFHKTRRMNDSNLFPLVDRSRLVYSRSQFHRLAPINAPRYDDVGCDAVELDTALTGSKTPVVTSVPQHFSAVLSSCAASVRLIELTSLNLAGHMSQS